MREEAKDFSKYEAERVNAVNTLQRAISIFRNEMTKNLAFLQRCSDTRNLKGRCDRRAAEVPSGHSAEGGCQHVHPKCPFVSVSVVGRSPLCLSIRSSSFSFDRESHSLMIHGCTFGSRTLKNKSRELRPSSDRSVCRFPFNMVAERGVWPPKEQILEKICEQIADVHVPQVVEQIIEVPKMAEQILDVLVPEMVEQLVKQPKTVSVDRIQERTAEQAVDILVPQDVEEPAEFFKASFLDGVQQSSVGQTVETPDITLAEKIVEGPVTQTEQVVNTSVQHVVDTVEVEKHIIHEKINQVTRHVEIPLLQIVKKTVEVPEVPLVARLQFTDKVVDTPVVAPRQISQLQVDDKAVDVAAVFVVLVPQVQVMAKTVQTPQLRMDTMCADEQYIFTKVNAYLEEVCM